MREEDDIQTEKEQRSREDVGSQIGFCGIELTIWLATLTGGPSGYWGSPFQVPTHCSNSNVQHSIALDHSKLTMPEEALNDAKSDVKDAAEGV